MRKFAIIFFLAALALTAHGQKPKPSPKKTPTPAKTVVPVLGTEAEEFDKAKVIADAAGRVAALETFIANFPNGTEVSRARGLIVSARAVLAEEKLNTGDVPAATALFKLAVDGSPSPIPPELFNQVILGFPLSLKARGQLGPAFEVVKSIEEKAGADAGQILDLAKFFISVQYGTEAIRLAERSVAIDPSAPAAHQTLAVAYKMNFRLEDAANAFAKALELAPESAPTRQNLAEMKRALGKPDEAAALYRETLALERENQPAKTGLVLALFESGKRSEAETELAAALEVAPKDAALLVGAAYWYAAAGDGPKAEELAKSAQSADPSNVWAYIAEARGLLLQKKPLDAERVLLIARRFADLPTLDYELASARMSAGYFREAAETLKRNFAVNKDGLVETYLGNRILADASNFGDLLSLERRAVIFARDAADDRDIGARLKALLELNQKLENTETPESEIARSVDEFTGGGDAFRLHRILFAASRLQARRTSPAKVLELMRAAVAGVDAALTVPNPSAAVLADELYDSRQYFISRSQLVSVNELPKQKLSAILRGRIEDTAAQALLDTDNRPQAIVRLKRALTVLPEKSTWWRSALNRLAGAYEADGNETEALEAYIKAYDQDQPNKEQRLLISALYVKVNGKLDGLDGRIGPDPFAEKVADASPIPTPPATLPQDVPLTPAPTSEPTTEATPIPAAETTPSPTRTPEPTPETTPEPTSTPTPEPTPTPTPDPTPESTPEPTPTPTPDPTPETTPEPTPTPTPEPTPTPTPEPTPESTPEPTPTPTPDPTPTPTPDPTPESTPEPTPESTPAPTQETTPEPTPKATPSPKPLFDPIIITIGKTDKPATDPSPEKPLPQPETTPTPELAPSPSPSPTPDKSNPNVAVEAPPDPTGETRRRVVAQDKPAVPCTLIVSQEVLSIIAGGGSLGVLAGFEDEVNDPTTITAASSSPDDIRITPDPGIGFSTRRAFFVVSSVSDKMGEFKITFRAECGTKEIQVKVR